MLLSEKYLIDVNSICTISLFDYYFNVFVRWANRINCKQLSSFFKNRIKCCPMFKLHSILWNEKINMWWIRWISMLTNKTETLVKFRFAFQASNVNYHWLRHACVFTHPKRLKLNNFSKIYVTFGSLFKRLDAWHPFTKDVT